MKNDSSKNIKKSYKTKDSSRKRINSFEGKKFFQFLGKAILSLAQNTKYWVLIEGFLNKKSKHLSYPLDFVKFLSLEDFKKWIFNEDLVANFNKIQNFKKIWGYKQIENSEKSLEMRHFCCALRRISLYYLENECFQDIFQKVHSENLKIEFGICYLRRISKCIRLLKSL